MIRAFLVLTITFLLSIGLSMTAHADSGVHDGYSATTDACSGCHRAHTGSGATLLKSPASINDSSEFCYSCHGATGQGADTNVQSGLYQSGRNDPYGDGTGAVDAPLKGGGFVQGKMSTGITNTATLANVSSSHTVNGTPGTLWGSGPVSATPNPGTANFQLTCTNCHDPHGNGNYRTLRPRPVGADATADVNIPDEQSKTYTVSGSGGVYNYFGSSYANSSTISSWCSSCHDRYQTGNITNMGITGTVYHPRHSNGRTPNCMNCHVAHGSTALMDPGSQAVPWPGGTTGRGADSSNLRLDGRGVCSQCHLVRNGLVVGENSAPAPTKPTTPIPAITPGPSGTTPTATPTPVAIGTSTPVPPTTGTPVPGGTRTPIPTVTSTPTSVNTPVPTTIANCTSCHGSPPSSGRHDKHVNEKRLSCSTCHAATVSNNTTIIDPARHANGQRDVKFAGGIAMTFARVNGNVTCSGSCHGKKNWYRGE